MNPYFIRPEKEQGLEKHLAGRHDQSTHAGGGSGSSAKPIQRIPESASQRNNIISSTKPYVGLSDKSKQVANRISPSTRLGTEENFTAKAVYTDEQGRQYNLEVIQTIDESASGYRDVRGQVTYSPLVPDAPLDAGTYAWGEPKDSLVYKGKGTINSFIPYVETTISSLDVSSNYRRRGLATAMLEFARRESGDVAVFHSWDLTADGSEFAQATKSVQKHQYGTHDQSTHGNNRVAGVPEGIDLEGKRYSLAAITELNRVRNNYQDAKYEAGKVATQERLKHDNTADGTKAYVESLENNKELQAARKELEENYLFKDAMNVKDANGVRLGDKSDPATGEDPEDYFLRKGATPKTGGADFDKDVVFYDNATDSEKFKGIRTTAEESIQVATQDFLEFADSADMAIVIPQSKLNTMMADGRYKTVHETRQSGGPDGKTADEYIDHRLLYENAAYGYDHTTPVEARPVSGMMVGEGGHVYDGIRAYGGSKPAEIVLKPEVRERTTWTEGDSLNLFTGGKSLSSTIFEPNYTAQKATVYRKGSGENYFKSKGFAFNTLVEIQVHGGVKVSDIGKVRFFNSPPSQALANRLEKAGIPYETIPTDEGA
jgi:hypothetical protein